MCWFCEGKDVYKTNYTELSIGNLHTDKAYSKVLNVKTDKCPPFVTEHECSAKMVKTHDIFIIEYCPLCGEKLNH